MSRVKVRASEPLALSSNTRDGQIELKPKSLIQLTYEEDGGPPDKIRKSTSSIEFEINDVVINDFQTLTSKTSAKTILPYPSNHSKLYSLFLQYRGILFAIQCCIFTSLAGFIVKYLLNKKYSASMCLLWRCPGIFLFSIASMLYKIRKKEPIFDSIWPWSENDRWKTFLVLILSRVFLGPASMLAQFYAFKFLELGDAETIVYSNSVFVTLFAHFILHESWGVVPIVASLITIIGVMIISKPPFIVGNNKKQPVGHGSGIGLAVTAMLLNTFVYITMRFLWNVHSSITLFVMSIASIVIGLIIAFEWNEFKKPEEPAHLAAFVGLALFTLLGSLTFTLALQYEEAGIVSLTRCLDVVFSFMLQMLLGVYPDVYSLGGATLVLSCISVIFFRKYLKGLPPDRPMVKFLWFLMK